MPGKKLLALFCAVLALSVFMEAFAVLPAFAEQDDASAFHFDENGFLTGENPEDEFWFEDSENGLWQYASASLAVTIRRTREPSEKNKKRIKESFIVDIHASPESPLSAIMTDPYPPNSKNPLPGRRQDKPTVLLEQHPAVFAVSDDMYGLRIQKVAGGKTRYDFPGVVIRSGIVMSSKTRNSAKKRAWPNMDTLAVYPDGSMKAFVCDAYTPEEYLAQGAVHVFAFGPVLISDGKINEDVLDTKKYRTYEPRVAIGMVEPWHYIIVATAGRPTSKYLGARMDWLAQTLYDLGCTEALNLDGGGTTCMAFRNQIILQGDYSSKKLRNVGSLIAFGLMEAAAGE